MAETDNKLGKLSLAILENFVESKLGKKFVKELRGPTDEQIAITGAMQATADRLWMEWADKELWNAAFINLPKENELLIALKRAVKTFYKHPSNTGFAGVLTTILCKHQEFSKEVVKKAVGEYITTLTEELALADDNFRENVRGLTELRMVEILKRVEVLLASKTIPNTTDGPQIVDNHHQVRPIKVEIIMNGKIKDFTSNRKNDTINVLAALLKIDPSCIKVLKVREGSIVVIAEMPLTAADRLYEMAINQDTRIIQLGITSISPEGRNAVYVLNKAAMIGDTGDNLFIIALAFGFIVQVGTWYYLDLERGYVKENIKPGNELRLAQGRDKSKEVFLHLKEEQRLVKIVVEAEIMKIGKAKAFEKLSAVIMKQYIDIRVQRMKNDKGLSGHEIQSEDYEIDIKAIRKIKRRLSVK